MLSDTSWPPLAFALLFSWAFLEAVVVVTADAFPAEYGTFIFHVTAGILFGLAQLWKALQTLFLPH
jgi:hypothetical protein